MTQLFATADDWTYAGKLNLQSYQTERGSVYFVTECATGKTYFVCSASAPNGEVELLEVAGYERYSVTEDHDSRSFALRVHLFDGGTITFRHVFSSDVHQVNGGLCFLFGAAELIALAAHDGRIEMINPFYGENQPYRIIGSRYLPGFNRLEYSVSPTAPVQARAYRVLYDFRTRTTLSSAYSTI